MNRSLLAVTAVLFLGVLAMPETRAEDKIPKQYFVYIGTYTGGESEGIYRYRLDLGTGRLTGGELAAKSDNPSFLAISPSQNHLYAVNEVNDFGGEKAGGVSAFALDRKTGALKFINQQSSKGATPCHLVVDKSGGHVLLANYSGGSVASLPIDERGGLKPAGSFKQHEGSSVNPRRQEGPHGHSINLDPQNKFAFAADLGLDKVLIYRFDRSNGSLEANDPAYAKVKPGAGPRHFAFHPSGRFAYVINEMHLTVDAFAYDAKRGELKNIQTITTLPKGAKSPRFSTAEVQVSPNGRFLYGSNRGHDTIAIFRIDQESGKLEAIGHQPTGGKTPRNFGIDPSGSFLLAANQSTNDIHVFRMNPETGQLTPTGQVVKTPSPVCVKFLEIDE